MGMSQGVCRATVTNDDGIVKCVPVKPLRKFPQSRVTVPGSLILEIKALPKKCYVVAEPVNGYWWTDAQFRPGDDTTFFVTCGCFTPRSTSCWTPAKRIPSGRITKYELDHENIKGEIFSYSFMANYPKIHTHPSGEYIGFIAPGSVMVETVLHEPVFEKQKDLRNCNYKYCTFSPNGKYLAILLSSSRRFELLISRLDRGFAFQDKSVDLLHIYKGFKGSNAYNEHLECKWSPDSSNIAVCTSIGFLVVLDNELKPVVNVFDDILQNETFPSCAGAFDYDPRYCHQVLSFGANNRCLYIVNTKSRDILHESETLSPDQIDCVQYSPSGDLIALSFRNWTLQLLETRNFETVFNLNMQECTSLTNTNISSGSSPFPSVMRLSFTSTGEQIATGSCDGFVRVWQLPRVNITLKNLTRQALLMFVPMSKLKNLPLPKRIIEELLSMPIVE